MQPFLPGPVAGGSSIRKGGATATAVRSKLVRLGPVSGLFPVHATGPLNTNCVCDGKIMGSRKKEEKLNVMEEQPLEEKPGQKKQQEGMPQEE